MYVVEKLLKYRAMYLVEILLKYRTMKIKNVPYLLQTGSHLMKPCFNNVVIFITILVLQLPTDPKI